MRLRHGQELSERDHLIEVFAQYTIFKLSSKNPIAYRYEKLDKFRKKKYITETAPMPLMRINSLHLCRRWKAGSGIGKGLLSKEAG